MIILLIYTSTLSHCGLFLPLEYGKMHNITYTTEVYTFICKQFTYTSKCIYSWNNIFIQEFITCVTNTHSILKYFPMIIYDVLPVNFYTTKFFFTKCTSNISWQLSAKPLLVLYFSCFSKHFQHRCMCSHKCWTTCLHLSLSATSILFLNSSISPTNWTNSSSHIFTPGAKNSVKCRAFSFIKSYTASAISFLLQAFCTHSTNLSLVKVWIHAASICTKMWYG